MAPHTDLARMGPDSLGPEPNSKPTHQAGPCLTLFLLHNNQLEGGGTGNNALMSINPSEAQRQKTGSR